MINRTNTNVTREIINRSWDVQVFPDAPFPKSTKHKSKLQWMPTGYFERIATYDLKQLEEAVSNGSIKLDIDTPEHLK